MIVLSWFNDYEESPCCHALIGMMNLIFSIFSLFQYLTSLISFSFTSMTTSRSLRCISWNLITESESARSCVNYSLVLYIRWRLLFLRKRACEETRLWGNALASSQGHVRCINSTNKRNILSHRDNHFSNVSHRSAAHHTTNYFFALLSEALETSGNCLKLQERRENSILLYTIGRFWRNQHFLM